MAKDTPNIKPNKDIHKNPKDKPLQKSPMILYHYNDRGIKTPGVHRKIVGDPKNIFGDCTRIYGDVSDINGDVTGLVGNISGLKGTVTGITGDATEYEGNLNLNTIASDKRKSGVRLEDLI